VPTPDNFGAAGQPPSHPELLDWLAVAFVEDGWSVKKMIRQLVLSRSYQLSTRYDPANHEADPDNVLVWRMSKRRLPAEAIRDAMLAVSGQLEKKPPVGSIVTVVGEGFANPVRFRMAGYETTDRHRSVYMPIVRDMLPEALAVFDFPDPTTVIGERPVTTVPAQALYLMNNPFVLRQSEAAAEALLAWEGTDEERLTRAYRRFFSRAATPREVDRAMEFLGRYVKAQKGLPRQARRAAWAALCQAFFASADFLYLN